MLWGLTLAFFTYEALVGKGLGAKIWLPMGMKLCTCVKYILVHIFAKFYSHQTPNSRFEALPQEFLPTKPI